MPFVLLGEMLELYEFFSVAKVVQVGKFLIKIYVPISQDCDKTQSNDRKSFFGDFGFLSISRW